jgi:peptidoglycan/LPS O-acetylase OafA/YrhL
MRQQNYVAQDELIIGQGRTFMALNYRPDIDGLRALAVVPVVFYHVGFGPSGGFSGVDIFFVISGFLITTIIVRDIKEGKFSILNFYERRVRRLFPALIFMLASTSVASLFFLIPGDLLEYAQSAIYALLFLANIFSIRISVISMRRPSLSPCSTLGR